MEFRIDSRSGSYPFPGVKSMWNWKRKQKTEAILLPLTRELYRKHFNHNRCFSRKAPASQNKLSLHAAIINKQHWLRPLARTVVRLHATTQVSFDLRARMTTVICALFMRAWGCVCGSSVNHWKQVSVSSCRFLFQTPFTFLTLCLSFTSPLWQTATCGAARCSASWPRS